MIGRKAIVGLSLLSALFLCAIVAQGASAAVAKNTTAFTCVEVSKGEFKDPHCDTTELGGKFAHELIPPATTTEIELTNAQTQNETKEAAIASFHFEFLKVKFTLTCKTVKGTGSIHNIEDPEKVHTFTGTIFLELTNCEFDEPLNCKVKEPITAEASLQGVEGLNGAENNMGLEFKGSKKEETVAELTFEGEKCAVKGVTTAVKGSVIATGTPPANAKEHGATWVFGTSGGAEMQKLTVGAKAAAFTGILTPRMVKGNPISLTTTT